MDYRCSYSRRLGRLVSLFSSSTTSRTTSRIPTFSTRHSVTILEHKGLSFVEQKGFVGTFTPKNVPFLLSTFSRLTAFI